MSENSQIIEQFYALRQKVENIYIPEVPVQPLFSAYKSAQTNNVTGDGTTYTVICDTEIFDIDGNYNNATGTFTAPVTGKYLFVFVVLARGITNVNNGGQLFINTSNRTYSGTVKHPYNSAYAGTDCSFLETAIADMDAADTAIGQIQVVGGGALVDVFGGAGGSPRTYFQGYLLI